MELRSTFPFSNPKRNTTRKGQGLRCPPSSPLSKSPTGPDVSALASRNSFAAQFSPRK